MAIEVFFFFEKNCIYLYLAVQSLLCSLFYSFSEWVAALPLQHTGFACCGFRLYGTWASIVVAPRL